MIREKFTFFSFSQDMHPQGHNFNMRSLLTFVTTRFVRGGPRLLLGLGLFVTLMILWCGSERVTDYSLGNRLGPILQWPSSPSAASDGGGLRIVVFGSPDLAAGVAPDGRKQGKSWTEQLCEELDCSPHLSFVPQANGHSIEPALVSNERYRRALDHLLEHDPDSSKPASNYTFLEEQYPIPSQPDLRDQVSAFLAGGQSAEPPKETLWVFSFGFWDVWHLAALPRDSGETAIDGMASYLFSQIERLYKESLSESSAAYSDFWSYSNPEVLEKLKSPHPKLADSRAETEAFRVLIPKILDPSITPGWNSMRDSPPAPHPKSEQVKNSAHLAERWNANMQAYIDEWKRSANPHIEYHETTEIDGDRAEARKRSSARSVPEDELEVPLYAPFPARKAALFDAPEFVLDAIVERQLQMANLRDTEDRGHRPLSDPIHFEEVQRPCSAGDGTSHNGHILEVLTGFHWSHPCMEPDQYLFSTPFTVAPRAVREIASRASALTRSHLYLEEDHEVEVAAREEPKRGSEASFARMTR